MIEQKSDCWELEVLTESIVKVCFDHPVSIDEAIEIYDDGEYDDILDEDWISSYAQKGKPIGDLVEEEVV